MPSSPRRSPSKELKALIANMAGPSPQLYSPPPPRSPRKAKAPTRKKSKCPKGTRRNKKTGNCERKKK
tara:strand:+ start:5175 stop:5378 length:204 start_codon:yes stop_codon:yes gene_type:complete